MKHFQVIISAKAQRDVADLKQYIKDDLQAPETASRYIEGLEMTVQKLSYFADAVGGNEFVQAIFGRNARHILYKRVAIIYAIRGDVVYVDRIIANSMIH
jgi:plasmid stabilization system protein ParE